MNIGDYVRTTNGISKIVAFYSNAIFNDKNKRIENNSIIKSSPNIIDLIEVGDYVNGSKVVDIAHAPTKTIYTEQKEACALIPITKDKLKSILTKEQFESMEYKL